jgi:hypothetical protein
MVLGLIGAVVLAHGSLLKAMAMIVLGLLLGMVGTDVNSGVARFSFDIPELSDGIGFVGGRDGHVRLRRDHHQPRAAEENREVFTDKVSGLLPDLERLQATCSGRCCAARRWVRSSAFCRAAARCWPRSPPTRSRRRSRKDAVERFGKGAIRRRGRSRSRQQRRCADLVHPAAHAGHPVQRR